MEEISSISSGNHDEDASQDLLPVRTRSSLLGMRYDTTRKCVSNKAALLILLWSFVVGLLSAMMLNPELYLRMFAKYVTLIAYGVAMILLCLFPLAGILADIKLGRYKAVVTSLLIVLLGLLLGLIMTGAGMGLALISKEILYFLGGIVAIKLYVGVVGFTANVVQFGMDQLHDSPVDDNTLFIHWYVWTYYASFCVVQLAWNFVTVSLYTDTDTNGTDTNGILPTGVLLLALLYIIVVIVLTVTLCLVRRRRRWFLIEPGGLNPYKLVYRVTKFARQHKTPVQCSAFTYCEDELPSGLDLGKEKYGGCFTTKQVEDVKAFYGILKVIFSFGMVFFMDFAADSILPFFSLHVTRFTHNNSDLIYDESFANLFFLNTGLLSPLLIVICIPLYLCLLRPFISQYIPGMLKRMGLGMFLVLLSLLTSLFMDTAAHLEGDHVYNNTYCMFAIDDDKFDYPSNQNPALLLIQLTLSALSHMLIYTAVFEFICSQSPHSMKGLFIGVLYAIRGLYQLVATLLVLPFAFLTIRPISCGFWYYLMNIVIGMVALLVYMCVAKRYRYREEDEQQPEENILNSESVEQKENE